MPKVWFVGAGPGDPELLTLKAQRLIREADAILYAGSLVSKAAMSWASESCEIQDSKGMTLEQTCDWLISKAKDNTTVLRLQTGDPGLYGALIEMIQPLDKAGIDVSVIPGVSSFNSAAARAQRPLADTDDTVAIIPAGYGLIMIESLLNDFDTLVLLKVKPLLDDIIDLTKQSAITK